MADPEGSSQDQEQQEEMLNYVNNVKNHSSNLKTAIDYHSVREPDLELISKEGRKLFGHRSVLGVFSQMLADIFSYVPCCQTTCLSFPDTSSEVLSHLLNVLYTGSTETSSDKVELLCGGGGVFATAKLLGINIKSDQKVIEVVDRSDNDNADNDAPAPTYGTNLHDESLDIADDEDEAEIVVEGEEEPETMEITPQIPMFDLGHFLYQEHAPDQPEEEPSVGTPQIQQVFQQHEDQDFYICKLPSCQTMIQFENCGARSKILNHYTSHFQRELEAAYGHLLSEDNECTLCGKQLKNYIKSKIWIHIGVTHDKTNDILIKKGIEPIRANIRIKRKASDAFRDSSDPGVSPPKISLPQEPNPRSLLLPPAPRMIEYPTYGQQLQNPGSIKVNTCKLCGQVTQNRKRLLKHYCTRHYIDRLSNLEFSYIIKNQCTLCGKDFVGAKKSSKVIHIGLEHKKIYDILDEEFGKDGFLKHDPNSPLPAPPPLKKIKPDPIIFRPIAPKIDFTGAQPLPQKPIAPLTSGVKDKPIMVNPNLSHPVTNIMPRIEASMSERMKEIQDLGNTCHVCGKQFDLFRSMLLPHYCGHFYKEIAQGHEDYFTEFNCKLCGATATKRKSRIIHLGVKHELVLPYIEDVLQSRNLLQKQEPVDHEEEEEEETHAADESQNEFVIDESEIKYETEEVNNDDGNDGTEDDNSDANDEPEAKVVTPLRIKVPSLMKIKSDEDSGTDVSQDGMTITRVVKEEKKVKETWITPNKSKSEVLNKWVTKQNNADNQDKPYHLDTMFSDGGVVTDDTDSSMGDLVTPETLGTVCKLCSHSETNDHELLTHYCSHFDDELRDISAKMIDEDHKCVECHKMLGNNKRRLFHFGVTHLMVIPLINKKLRNNSATTATNESSLTHSVSISRITKKKSVDDSMTEEDDFEITYDSPAVSEDKKRPASTSLISKTPVTGHKNPRTCELCGCKRNTSYNLMLHCTKQHFIEEIVERWGGYMVGNTCQICHEVVDINIKNVGELEKWIHLGHKHGKTNTLLRERGKRMIIIKGYNDHDFDLENTVEQTDDAEEVEEDNGVSEATPQIINSGGETGASSEEDVDDEEEEEEEEISTAPVVAPVKGLVEYNCPLCEKTTKNQNLLDLHLIAIHFKKELLAKYGNPENTCTICAKQFQNVDAFAFHIGKDHDLLKVIMEQGLENDGGSEVDSSPEAKLTITRTSEVRAPPALKPAEHQTPGAAAVTAFVCFKCGAKRRGMKELYGHYSLQHFSKELMEEHGVHKKCTFDNCTKNLENGTAWVSHLGQEHPSVLDKHIPEQHWQHKSDSSDQNNDTNQTNGSSPGPEYQCPLNCKKSFPEKSELLSHFKSVHGFSNEIIQKMIKAHPQLNSLSDGKVIEAQ